MAAALNSNRHCVMCTPMQKKFYRIGISLSTTGISWQSQLAFIKKNIFLLTLLNKGTGINAYISQAPFLIALPSVCMKGHCVLVYCGILGTVTQRNQEESHLFS